MAVTKKIKTVFQFRRATTEEWGWNKTVVPAAGEPCYDLDLKTLRIGDGVTPGIQLVLSVSLYRQIPMWATPSLFRVSGTWGQTSCRCPPHTLYPSLSEDAVEGCCHYFSLPYPLPG